MSATDILIVGALVVFVAILLRASAVLSKSTYQQLKAHEDLAGPLPNNLSAAEKLRQINVFGVSPTNPLRPWFLVLVVVVFCLLVVWLA